MDPKYPISKTQAAIFLSHSHIHLYESEINGHVVVRNYNDHKAQQLFSVLSDLLFAEAQIEAWSADLGSTGCQVEGQ